MASGRGSPEPDLAPWGGNSERVKELKQEALPVFDYLGGVIRSTKGPKNLKTGPRLVEQGPDALALAKSQGRPMTPDDCIMEGSEFCTLDLVQHYSRELIAAEAASGGGSGSGRSNQAHLPCPNCHKWSLCNNGPDRSNVRMCTSEHGVLFVLPFSLKCRECKGECLTALTWHGRSSCQPSRQRRMQHALPLLCLLCVLHTLQPYHHTDGTTEPPP